MDYKKTIINELSVLHKKEVANKQPFKAKAYMTVITNLKKIDHPIYSFDDLKDVKGIGEKIKEKIAEIFSTGVCQAAQKARDDKELSSENIFTGIYGIGPVKAKELVEIHKLYTIEDLRKKVKTDNEILNDKQMIGLSYYEDLKKRIPRSEMNIHNTMIQTIAKKFKGLTAIIVGSYRRGSSDSGDIDILLTTSDDRNILSHFVNELIAIDYILETLAEGTKKFMGICRINGQDTCSRRIDILFTPREEYPWALLYFTGSQELNVQMRSRALELGYSINEHRAIPVDHDELPPIMDDEKDIFDFLGMKYLKPEDRNL